jgi:purine/pyrimidine-nucleoside phosphorylase
MTSFNNVTIIKKANVYFNGQVSSRTIQFSDGSEKTLGFMLPGEYKFNTDSKELMEILAGKLSLLLPDTDNWQTIQAGDSFEIPANSHFIVNVIENCDYCCSFLT